MDSGKIKRKSAGKDEDMMMEKKKSRYRKTDADWIPKSWTAFIEIH